MNLYLPIAEMSVDAFYLLGIGLLTGILSGIYGIGGGIITVPALIFFGIPSPIAVGTSANQIVGTAFAGVLKNWNSNSIDFKIGSVIFIGSIIGSFAGIQIFIALRKIGYIDLAIAIVYIAILSLAAITIYSELGYRIVQSWIKKGKNSSISSKDGDIIVNSPQKQPYLIYSALLDKNYNIFMLIILGLIVGMISAIIGVGGAIILIPALIYIGKMPIKIASATALYQSMLSCINVSALQAINNHTVDIILSSVMLSTSVFGVQIGLRVAAKMHNNLIKFSLACILTLLCAKFIYNVFGNYNELKYIIY